MTITGRMHQIRIQLSGIKTPILNDFLYGTGVYYKGVTGNKKKEQDLPINRHALFASDIQFVHPVKKVLIRLKSRLPYNFEKLILSFFKKIIF